MKRKRWRKILSCAAIILCLTALVMVYLAGSQIASPPRRDLMGYHREFLADPALHGLMIERFTASDGTPCLVCLPDASGRIGERGMTIRNQLTASGRKLHPAGQIIGTLVLLHGRKGRKEDYLPIAERLCASGFRCVIPDMPAHGEHPVNIATYGIRECGIPSMVLNEAARKFSFDPKPAGLLGMSMGGSVAMHAADLADAPWKTSVIVSSFDSFPTVIEGQASRYVGSWIGHAFAGASGMVYRWKTGVSISKIQPHQHASALKIPTLVAHGTNDRVIPITSGKRLFDAVPSVVSKQWIEIPGADHDNVLITDYPIYSAIAAWMLDHVPE